MIIGGSLGSKRERDIRGRWGYSLALKKQKL